MKSNTVRGVGRAFLALSALLLLISAASADTGPTYDLSWWTVDGGGATSTKAGAYSLGGTMGQVDAGPLAHGDYVLTGGFWGGVPVRYPIYLPLVARDSA